ncbi:dual specificity protein phosphatase family protein [Gimesia sp.]|uniref:dual specificity protein phosphatase family protein n=1 Tax=Gimesia sp. TaxID=2024833 RepID=UPI0032EED080
MRIGFLLLLIAVLLVLAAGMHQGLRWLLLWPAFSFALVAAGYLGLGPRVFNKSQDGLVPLFNRCLLFPYLLYLNGVWHGTRLLRPEPPLNQLTENLFVSRRLLSHELPAEIVHVIDLTCEQSEPRAQRLRGYHCFPVLDREAPAVAALSEWIPQVAALQGPVLIHCAEGHGRTGLFTAALLLYTRQCGSVEESLRFIQSQRPLVRLSAAQRRVLQTFYEGLETAAPLPVADGSRSDDD